MTADFATGAKDARHPQDWYVEQAWVVRALMSVVEFHPDYVVYDPACGLGTIPGVFAAAGIQAGGTDLIYRGCRADLFHGEHDFLGDQVHILERWPLLTIVCNPPFSYRDGIAEAFVRRSLKAARGKVCMLLPLKWRASEGRHALFEEYPADIHVLADRPSMPPGDKLDQRDAKGNLTAWKRGKVDYAWFVWERHRPNGTGGAGLVRGIAPRSPEKKRIDRDEDLRRVGLIPQLAEAAE